ncbi:hypothetical protein [Planomicrobium okeanokoites]|uniref:hypothetical protein n=1 Tax=Planomicrobium okeanokoites TaxID=244 RepID=UPI002492FB26|nr:hypothetical protein [Planomicrobium okeanokoites]
MYKAFQYKDELSIFSEEEREKYSDIGKRLYDSQKHTISNDLKSFYLKNGVLNGTKLKESWFPSIEAHVFFSHSHVDKDVAIILAGYLYDKFNIISFIDSNVWGYANDLLKEIDNKYCKNTESNTYNYSARNFSTSHIHMMLNTALMEMIDKTECIIFINTDNSIESLKDTIEHATYSPWIYSELNMIKFMKLNPPKRTLEKVEKSFGETEKRLFFESLTIGYHVTEELEGLNKLSNKHLVKLSREASREQILKSHYDDSIMPGIVLDSLYSMFKSSYK